MEENVLEGLECVYVKPDTLTDKYQHYCPGMRTWCCA
jgi:hypothetical protein